MTVPSNHWTPGQHVINVALPIGVPQVGAFCAFKKARCAPYGFKGAHRRVHATRYVTLGLDRKSTRLNSSHVAISYAVFCLKKKKKTLRSLRNYHRNNL